MNQTINLMTAHYSVRKFKQEAIKDEDLKQIIQAGRCASTWMNFQSYSVIVVKSAQIKQQFYDILNQESVLSCDTLVVFVGDLYRASQVADYHGKNFAPEGVDRLLISSVDASLAAQNTLLAAESLGLGGVIIGTLRTQSELFSQILDLPVYTYPLLCLALGVPDEIHQIKPRLPYEAVVFETSYRKLAPDYIAAYDKIQAEVAGSRQETLWSERLSNYFAIPENPSTKDNLKAHRLLKSERE
ncbi:MAG: nitroreductase family protein [Streptococcaceae bacterium]|nr:nitroreductase family protein [Streptococcaceae bacterium]